MKLIVSTLRRCALVAAAFVCIAVCSSSAQAKITPFIDCVELEADGEYTTFFGYYNDGNAAEIPIATNFFQPGVRNRGQPTTFLPGYNHRVFGVTSSIYTNLTWNVNGTTVTTGTGNPRCGSTAFTYQGKLSEQNAPASGSYDLQFRLFNEAAGGTLFGTNALENVPVVNGVFTVSLDFGSAFINQIPTISFDNTIATTPLTSSKERYLQIAIRPGSASGSDPYTILVPRQPISAAPLAQLAFNAVSARNALNAQTVGGRSAADLVSKSAGDTLTGTYIVNGTLNVNGTLTTGCKSGFTAIADGRLCVSAMQAAATFYGASGAIKTCANMSARVGNSADLMLTIGSSLDYRGGLTSGWLADHIGDNVWATWTSGFGETDFDGVPLNVIIGGANNTAPVLPYRCVY